MPTYHQVRSRIEILAMNIKFRLPKLWSNTKVRSTAKELLLTIIATTISIILTFGTAAYLDNKQQKADGRQTAMLAIHDIEKTAETFEGLIKGEEDSHKLTQYVIDHLDKIDSIRNDTLNSVLQYLLQTESGLDFDDSNEKLFLSSQDVWKNINNPTFIDVVQRFFYNRRTTYDLINNTETFHYPIAEAEIWQPKYFKANGTYNFAGFLAERLPQPEVQMFLLRSYGRIKRLTSFLDYCKATAKRCKFIMEISDEELNEYIARRMNPGLPPTDKQLEGIWEIDGGGEQAQEFEFRKDHTFTATSITRSPNPFYLGRMNISMISTGTWQIEGDSIIFFFDPSFDYSFDDSNITVVAGKEKEWEEFFAKWKQSYEDSKQGYAGQDAMRKVGTIFIDRMGQRIELMDPGSNIYEYFTRKEQ